jgi:DNA primase
LTVSFGSSSDVKEQVRQAIDIVDLVGSYVQLRRQGRGYVALCPWHDDTRPSLQVNPERQSFKCWVCDIGGDVFSFLMKMEGVEFREALDMLAERAGVPLERIRPAAAASAAASGTLDKQTLYKAAAWVEQKYHECLLGSPEAEPARRYLQERGITPQSIKRFHLGFSPPGRDWILQQAGGDASRARVLEAIGVLARPSGGGELYDRFRGRLLFSIRDVQGRPVGLGGRILPEEKGDRVPSGCHLPERPATNQGSVPEPRIAGVAQMGTVPFFQHAKYLNSTETPLFTKNRLLYGLDVARDAVRKGRVALVMEGYTDVIVAHQYGFDHAVAVLGTALGENHVRILKRFADRIVLVLDGDEAGQKRTNEVLELFIAQQVDLDVLTLPDGLDPCDLLLQRGSEALAELLAGRTVDALEHAFQAATRGVDLDRDVHAATQALERLVGVVAKAPRLRPDTTRDDRLREAKFLQRLATLFRVDEAEVRQRLTTLRRGRRQPSPSGHAESPEAALARPPGDPLDPTEREMLELLLLYPEQWPAARGHVPPERFAAGVCRQLYETGCRLLDAGRAPTFDRLMLELDDAAMKSLLVDLDEAGRAKGGRRNADPAALVETLREKFYRKEVEKRRAVENVALREQQLDPTQVMDLLRSRYQQERGRQGISEPTDG